MSKPHRITISLDPDTTTVTEIKLREELDDGTFATRAIEQTDLPDIITLDQAAHAQIVNRLQSEIDAKTSEAAAATLQATNLRTEIERLGGNANAVLQVTKNQLLKELVRTGKTEQDILNGIDLIEDPIAKQDAAIDWKHSTHVIVDHPAAMFVGSILGYDDAERRAFFQRAALR